VSFEISTAAAVVYDEASSTMAVEVECSEVSSETAAEH
jgi:hypothetical protein